MVFLLGSLSTLQNLLPGDLNNWPLFTDSKVRSRNWDPDLSDVFSNPRIPGVVFNQLLMLELYNIKNIGLAKYYLANAICSLVKNQLLESDKPEFEFWPQCLLKLCKPEFPHLIRKISNAA